MILCISLFLICNKNIYADGYNYASFKWEDFKEQYKDYWTTSCEKDEDSEKCTETVLKSQKKFFNKLYKMLTKYEKNGLYIKDEIIIGTLYYGLTPDAFRDDNIYYSKWFDNISFDFDKEDDTYQFAATLKKMGVDKALYEKGARDGDQVIVGTFIMDYSE